MQKQNHTEEIHLYRKYLYKVALIQVKNHDIAEDLVSDTILAFLEKPENFRGEANIKTYLIAILKFKIIDYFRKKDLLVSFEDNQFDQDNFDDLYNSLFTENLHWNNEGGPQEWPTPDEAFINKQFWVIFQACMLALPAQQATIFTQRELYGDEIKEICKNFSLSTTNVSVLLYRARMHLRQCLEIKWLGFNQDSAKI